MHALTASVDSVLLSLHLAIHEYAVCEHNDKKHTCRDEAKLASGWGQGGAP